MKLKVLIAGVVLELGYLFYLMSLTMPSFTFEMSPVFAELSKHGMFQVVVLTVILIGAFMNGKSKAE